MDSKKSVLVVGYNYYSIKECIKNGFNVDVLIDKWDYLYGSIYPIMEGENRIYVEECANVSLALEAMYRNIGYKKEYFAVFSDFEFTIITAGILKDLYKADKGLNAEEAILFRDKFAQKKSLKGIVPVAKTQLIERLSWFHYKDLVLEYPLVLKPIAGAGAEDTFKINTVEEFVALKDNLLKKGFGDKSFLIEEFIKGEEIYIDGIVSNSNLEAFSVGKYWEPLLSIKDNKTIKTMLLHPKSYTILYERVDMFLQKIFSRLGFKNGVFHMEAFLTGGGSLIFSECAARAGGGMLNQAFQYLYGVSLKEALPQLSIGVYKECELHPNNIVTGFALIPSINPKIKKLPTLEELQNMIPNIQEVIYEWNPGDELPDITRSSTKRVGMFLVVSKNEIELKNDINKCLEYFMGL